jgi:4-hydroxybenzoate polyprenyltransferase
MANEVSLRNMTGTLRNYIELMRLHRPIGILLLLWPTLWALWIAAKGIPDLHVLVIFVTGVVVMRSAGVVINDFADRRFDRHVERTRERPLTSGRVSARAALTLFAVLCVLSLALVLMLNRLTLWLALGGALLAVVYPFMKRVTHLPQVVLGAAFGWAVPMAFAAQSGSVPPIGWLMFTATVLWATVYDTMYAMVDRQDDLVLGLKSTAILFGDADRVIIGLLQLMVLICLLMIGHQAELGPIYFGCVGVATAFSVYQQYLIRFRNREDCFRAFLNNNWFGMVVFLGILLDYQYG